METANIQADILQVRRIYESGTPFFTKQALGDIVRQLEGNNNKTVVVTGLNGKQVEFHLETGKVMTNVSPFFEKNSDSQDDSGTEAVWSKVSLRYHTIHHLTLPESHRLRPEHPFLTTSIGYTIEFRNSRTKAPITRIPRLYSMDQMRYRFEMEKALWQDSTQFSELLYILAAAPYLPPITKIVAFACGSVTLDDVSGARHARQHAAVISLREYLKDKQKRLAIPCFAQDPEYMERDRTILQEKHGITILDDPRAFLEVDDETLVFAIAPNIPVRQIVTDIARPGVMIWDKVVPNLRPYGSDGSIRVETDPSSSRLESLVRDYYWEYELSNDADCIRGARVYVRRPDQPPS